MMVKHPDAGVVILAAGRGTRINAEDLPKVLIPLWDRPIISHLLSYVQVCGAALPATIVIGHQGGKVQEALGPDYRYVWQDQPLGTGHALRCAASALANRYDHIVVLYGDHPYVPSDAIDQLISLHKKEKADLSLMTATVPDFDDWRSAFTRFGRIVRNSEGKISRIVEYKDATDEEKSIKEVNPAYFCFRAAWLWSRLELLKNNNAQGEYYLTDLVGIAMKEGAVISSISIDPRSALGVNTDEDLERVQAVLKSKLL